MNKTVDFKTHEFKLRDKDELNTFKFVALHRCATDYFQAQKDILVKNMEESLEKYKTKIFHREVRKLQDKEIDKNARRMHIQRIDLKDHEYPRPTTGQVKSAMKNAERTKAKEMAKLNKTFAEFIAINERMYNHMDALMQADSMDAVVEDIFTFTDTIITQKDE